jgi:hydrogenase/urease accessory protein HupE
MRRLRLAWVGLLAATAAVAHEVRPAYLELREQPPGKFAVLWKTPMRGEMRLALEPEFSGDVKAVTQIMARMPADAAVQEWTLHATELRGQSVHIRGLESTMTDVLLRVEFADGTSWTKRLTPQEPAAIIPPTPSRFEVARTYLRLGTEHILLGIDHLLFVLALIIIARGVSPLVKTVTAFTLAHSVTLALATLGFVHVPQPPVEAAIALSIAFVAAEIVRARHGRQGVTSRAPWLVAFGFGLLHGLGFAQALADAGLPQKQVPLALLFFNLGVEAGQLAFIAAVLALAALARRTKLSIPRWAPLAPPYAIGIIATLWTIQRIAAF